MKAVLLDPRISVLGLLWSYLQLLCFQEEHLLLNCWDYDFSKRPTWHLVWQLQSGAESILSALLQRDEAAWHTCDPQLSFLATQADGAKARKETASGIWGQAPAFTATNLAWRHCWMSSHESPFSYYGTGPSEEASPGFCFCLFVFLEADLEITELRKRTRLGWKWEASQHIYFGFLYRLWKPNVAHTPFLWPLYLLFGWSQMRWRAGLGTSY